MKHRNCKIKLDKFIELFYEKRLKNCEIAKYFSVGNSAIGSFRKRHDLPPRGWANGSPMSGKRHNLASLEKISKSRIGKNIGKNNHNWNGGRITNTHGYILINVKDRPNTYRNYILEHRYIMEEHIGRFLDKNETVHHINGNKTDNRIENLELLTRSSHASLHSPKGSLFGIHKSGI